jgi:hypothetical protein
MNRNVHRAMPDGLAGRIFAGVIVIVMILRRPGWPLAKATTTIGANVFEYRFNARTAKRAFETADHGLGRVRWKRNVAVFAGGSQLKHGRFLP